MEERPHVPGQTDAEFPDPITKEPEAPPAPETPPADPPEPPKEDPNPEPEKEKEGDEPADAPKDKKRSIYDDYQDKKREAKDATARAEAAEAKVAELTDLLAARDEAKTPEEKKEAADDIAAFAEREGMRPDALRELTDIIAKRIPKPDGVGLTPEEVEAWRASQAAQKRDAEDRAILETAPSVKEQLGIHDETELQAVMKEVVRLAHTKDFHDKEVEYIVWKNREALSKMVSPKKPSFEPGGQPGGNAGTEPDFSSGAITPGMAQKAIEERGRGSGYDVRQNR